MSPKRKKEEGKEGKEEKERKKSKKSKIVTSEEVLNSNPHEIINPSPNLLRKQRKKDETSNDSASSSTNTPNSSSNLISSNNSSSTKSSSSISCAQPSVWSSPSFQGDKYKVTKSNYNAKLKQSNSFYKNKIDELVEKSYNYEFERKLFYFEDEKVEYSPINQFFEQKTEFNEKRANIQSLDSICIACGSTLKYQIGNISFFN
jgi:hypothetical protein